MTPDFAVGVFRQALVTSFSIALPLLAIGLVAGTLVSLLQVLTSIQDSSFGAVPRLAAFTGALLLLMPWMTSRLISYTVNLFSDFSRYAR